MSVFDGLPDIFTGVLGESVVYTPKATGVPKTIQAIWIETPISVEFDHVEGDSRLTELSVRAEDVPAPAEMDTAQRVRDGKIMKVTTPIRPDGKGLVVCNLAEGE